MSCEDKARAVLCCHLLVESRNQLSETGGEFQFFQARQTVDRFDFEILPMGILDKHYFARHLPLKPLQNLDGQTAERIRAAASSIAASSSTRVDVKRMGEQNAAPSSRPSSESPSSPEIRSSDSLQTPASSESG
jgi:hypothetical protein